MVPEGWSYRTISEILEKVSNPVDVDSSATYREIGIRSHGKGIFHKEPILGKILGNKRVFHIEPGCFVVNIVFAWEQAIAKTSEAEVEMIASHRFPMFRPKSGLCDIDFILYFFNTKKGKFLLELASPGGAGRNKTLGQSEFAKLGLLLPSAEEQKKIAQILSTWDKAITTTEQLLANSQQQQKALMQQLLTGKKRLLDNNGVRFSGEWKSYHLSHVSVIVMGSSPKSEAYNENGIGLPLLQGNADIKNRISAPRVFTSEITKECEIGDILLSVRAPVGTVAISEHKACIGRGIAALHTKPNFDQSFIYQFLLWFEPKWGSLSQGSTFESINSDDIKNLKIKVPNFGEQQKIAAVLSTADKEISALQQKLDALKQEKNALMQQLLTGKRRVKVDDKEIA
ncbi:restriction endonuclease subunit S [Vibrio vulnificus]|uniref:restriction endonuclease subunit S n=1 Tax=Vibrio vulnificus TaxID=672 RepID=UPI001028E3F0|nr:restriction endonuclease subunit S [Vibrio vulnificus]ELV8577066.1 restriction endonuclease subunit S [Vibrio vulnificus]RZR25744.1 restriction endonuclease subunit S [Vibrio vulnificus]